MSDICSRQGRERSRVGGDAAGLHSCESECKTAHVCSCTAYIVCVVVGVDVEGEEEDEEECGDERHCQHNGSHGTHDGRTAGEKEVGGRLCSVRAVHSRDECVVRG